ncbi:hypothetical protein [Nesterenkonia populi]|uniref:hypothetical protein n=1 Tax=Nesterenkonia populi TaxID=1591087 RepID=UPI0011BE2B92|nr:hypothetical protein [Nesterenkonia populi]
MTTTPPSGGQPGTTTSPSGAPAGGQRSPEKLRADLKWLGWGMLAVVIAWGTAQLPLPYKLLAVAAGLAGIALGVLMLVRSVRVKAGAMMHLAAVFTGLCCGLLGISAGAQALFWEATAEFEACTERAVTDRAHNQCLQDYEDSMLSPLSMNQQQ